MGFYRTIFAIAFFIPSIVFASFDYEYSVKYPDTYYSPSNFYIDYKGNNYINEFCFNPSYFALTIFNFGEDVFYISNAFPIDRINEINRFRFEGLRTGVEYNNTQLEIFDSMNDYNGQITSNHLYSDDKYACEAYDAGASYILPFTIKQNETLINITTASTSDMLGSVGTLFTDLWAYIAVIAGIPLAFYVMTRVRNLFIIK